MLKDEIPKYTELSGNDGWHTPICVIGAYLDGYEKGLESRENMHGEWINNENGTFTCNKCGEISCCKGKFCCECGADMRGET